jgi:ring-1,2-phenylacetyl-CoA epoxidase subunit PaaC
MLAERVGGEADALVYGRPEAGFRNAQFVEMPRTNWAFSLVRQFLYDQYDQLRLESLSGSKLTALAEVIGKIQREEKYHAMHGTAWMHRLAENTSEARARLEAVLPAAWAATAGLFEPLPGEDLLVREGHLAQSSADFQAAWTERVGGFLRALGVGVPDVAPTGLGGRAGRHSADFAPMWDEMTIVYRIDPAARW